MVSKLYSSLQIGIKKIVLGMEKQQEPWFILRTRYEYV